MNLTLLSLSFRRGTIPTELLGVYLLYSFMFYINQNRDAAIINSKKSCHNSYTSSIYEFVPLSSRACPPGRKRDKRVR
jgi:hypothetical protein